MELSSICVTHIVLILIGKKIRRYSTSSLITLIYLYKYITLRNHLSGPVYQSIEYLCHLHYQPTLVANTTIKISLSCQLFYILKKQTNRELTKYTHTEKSNRTENRCKVLNRDTKSSNLQHWNFTSRSECWWRVSEASKRHILLSCVSRAFRPNILCTLNSFNL